MCIMEPAKPRLPELAQRHLSASAAFMSLMLVSMFWSCSGAAIAQAPQHIIGQARVVDGDTIEIGSIRIRLWGIDAPESAQPCQTDRASYDCGAEAKKQLQRLVLGKSVDCVRRTLDRYGRIVALCTVDHLDISAEMVRTGWALAFVRYSSDYVAQEQEAHLAKRGMWSGTFEPPWDWRRR